MDQVPELVIAFIVSALLTLFDLDRTFYIPSTTQRKLILYGWWWGFIFGNGLLAAGLEGIFGNANSLKSIDPLLRAALIGAHVLELLALADLRQSFRHAREGNRFLYNQSSWRGTEIVGDRRSCSASFT